MVTEIENPEVHVRGQSFRDPNELARTELVRFRCRLGSLTNEQELQIEDLLMSTITKISLITGRVMNALNRSKPND